MIYLFTDGGAIANGKINCEASWGYVLVSRAEDETHKILQEGSGLVPKISIAGKAYQASNNRGEILGIIHGITAFKALGISETLYVVSDSQYAIKCITQWYPSWVKKNLLHLKLNVDLLSQVDALTKGMKITYTHVRSHKEEPLKVDTDWFTWFAWYYNSKVDELCSNILRDVKCANASAGTKK